MSILYKINSNKIKICIFQIDVTMSLFKIILLSRLFLSSLIKQYSNRKKNLTYYLYIFFYVE